MVVNLGTCAVGRCGTRGYRGFGRDLTILARPALDARIEASITTMQELESASPMVLGDGPVAVTQTVFHYDDEPIRPTTIDGVSQCPFGHSLTSLGCVEDIAITGTGGGVLEEKSSIGIWALVALAVVGAVALS